MERKRKYKRMWIKSARAQVAAARRHFGFESETEEELHELPLAAYSRNINEPDQNVCAERASVISQHNPIQHLQDNELPVSGDNAEDIHSEHSGIESDNDVWTRIDSHNTNLLSDSDTETEGDKVDVDAVKEGLSSWSTEFGITHRALDGILKLLKDQVPDLRGLPTSSRTLLKTPKHVELTTVSGMDYFHFGLKSQLIGTLELYPRSTLEQLNTLDLIFNIDGLPLFRSSRTTVWPVLCVIQNIKPSKVFPVTITSGTTKPANLDFLQDTINELKELIQYGLSFGNRTFLVNVKCIVCDAPARAFAKGTKLCSGYHGCDKCDQKGSWFGRVTYQEVNPNLRTDQSFRNFDQAEHHIGQTPFTQLPIDMIKTFSIDYMHQVCLGVVKRLILLWKTGPRAIRISDAHISEINNRLWAIKPCVPNDFARKPRGLNETQHWKATEYRQFLLYTGQFALKGILQPQHFEHYMSLSVAMCILISPKHAHTHKDFAQRLLVWFIQKGKELYGNEFLVYNVHSLMHLTDEAVTHGDLDSCAAWRFESFLYQLKKLVRSGKNPVAQIVKRLTEQQPQRITSGKNVCRSTLVNRPNNAYMLKNGEFCEIIDVQGEEGKIDQETHLLCRVYKHKEALFSTPCDSQILNFVKCHQNQARMKDLLFSCLAAKCMMIDKGVWKIFLTLLHDDS